MLYKFILWQLFNFNMLSGLSRATRLCKTPVSRNAVFMRSMTSNPQEGHRPISEEQRERTFIAIKPDAVQRGLVGEIISRFEKRGFKLVGIKVKNVTRELAQAKSSSIHVSSNSIHLNTQYKYSHDESSVKVGFIANVGALCRSQGEAILRQGH